MHLPDGVGTGLLTMNALTSFSHAYTYAQSCVTCRISLTFMNSIFLTHSTIYPIFPGSVYLIVLDGAVDHRYSSCL